MNATASKLNFKLKLERYFPEEVHYISIPNIIHKMAQYSMSWLFYKACPALCPWLTLNLLSPNLTMSASSCFYTHSCVSLQQLWRYSSIEWARSWVQPQNCKNKTTNTTAQRHTHKAFPKSQLMSSPSLVPPCFTCLFTLSQHCLLQLQSVIESQLEAQCSFILVFPLPGSSQ